MNVPSFDPDRNYLVYIVDMLESIDHINSYCHGISEIEFSRDIKLQDAVIRRFQIIGQAAGKVPKEVREMFQDIPWAKIVAMRNLIIHDYANVAYNEVWRVIQDELPLLYPQLGQVRTYLEKVSSK